MTAAAVEAELTIVNIVRAVTVGTAAAQPGLCGQGTSVTAVASNLEMRTLQDEVRLTVVIELPLQPVHGVVAQGTVFREAVRVRVVFTVTLGALRGRVAEYMGIVARVALLVSVRAQQRETCQPMVEEHLVGPGVLVVAVQAVRPLRAGVGVVFFVAREATCLRLGFEYRLYVTGLAFDEFVCTVQHMLRVHVVVEVNRRPCVGGMAGLADAPEVPVVIVVFRVAGDARDVHLVVERVFTVAVAAGQLRVFAVEREARVARMIEFRVFPAGR